MKDESWLSGKNTYEGFPMYLRRPRDRNYDLLPPKLVVVTHLLDHTSPDGLPLPDYNDTLFDLDADIIQFLGSLDDGSVVLIETFGHKRNYYANSAPSGSVDLLREYLDRHYPDVRFEYFEKDDPGARFIRKYAQEWF